MLAEFRWGVCSLCPTMCSLSGGTTWKSVLLLVYVCREIRQSTPSLVVSSDQSAVHESFSFSSLDIGFTSSTNRIVWGEDGDCWAERDERIVSMYNCGWAVAFGLWMGSDI